MGRLPFKPNWGNRPNTMAAALYHNRRKKRSSGGEIPLDALLDENGEVILDENGEAIQVMQV